MPAAPDPQRFTVSPGTLRFDAAMSHLIRFGGLAIIVAVFAIFVYILLQVIPLFAGARVSAPETLETGAGEVLAVGVDEWGAYPFVLDTAGEVRFVPMAGNAAAPLTVGLGGRLTAAAYAQNGQRLLVATAAGQISLHQISYKRAGDGGQVSAAVRTLQLAAAPSAGHAVRALDFDLELDSFVYALIEETPSGPAARVVRTSLQTTGEIELRDFAPDAAVQGAVTHDLGEGLGAPPVTLLVTEFGDGVLVATADGQVHHFVFDGRRYRVREVFQPFAGAPDPTVRTMHFLLGKVTAVFGGPAGLVGWSNNYDATVQGRRFVHTKTFSREPAGEGFFAKSLRNRGFLAGVGRQARLTLATTEDVRWQGELPAEGRRAVISEKYDAFFVVDAQARLHRYGLDDPHAEASLKAFFTPVWYEGAPGPAFIWQSTGGSNDFEPKLSLVPLIYGTLKGTTYALVFAVPIALLAALYTSQFLRPALRNLVKPTMEIMASLPSVVLGFFGALVVAPAIERHMPAVLLMLVALPATAILVGYLWQQLPIHVRLLIPAGLEFVVFLPILVACVWLCWVAGPALEQVVFVVQFPGVDGGAPERVADFRLWWPEVTGTPFNQRNALVVGFMMGFAVIPIIFTIAEDALSNVPSALVSGSLALGASRWQTTARVVVPMASAGIFSALMIGLGRAVGETMIVVMATGNTAVMEWNPFSGMRTLSANVAVELPEAPQDGTLYRTLFFGALCLFLMTFLANTVAEVLRTRLREKYKAV